MGSQGNPLLDPAALEGLREIGGDEFLADLIETFLADAPALLAALRGTDADEVRRAAHTLKSNAATFGATRLSELCRELELLAKTGDLSGAPDLAARIEAEYAHVAAELRT
jgi:HPt (histidine-containing phosphotransfer) domain-containing protein